VEKYKARVVVRGSKQRHGIDFDEDYVPVARMETIRILFDLDIEEKMYIHQIDIWEYKLVRSVSLKMAPAVVNGS